MFGRSLARRRQQHRHTYAQVLQRDSFGRPTQGSDPLAAQPRRARLAAMVRSAMGGSLHSRSVNMLPLGALPATLAHRLASLPRHGGGAPVSLSSLGEIELQKLPLVAEHSVSSVDDWLQASAKLHSAGSQGGDQQAWQWGLDTQSLRLSANELEVRGR